MKNYTIIETHHGREKEVSGTVEELTKYFFYTLDCGHSWNTKINLAPKTAKSLINNLNRSVHETQGGCFDQDHYELKI